MVRWLEIALGGGGLAGETRKRLLSPDPWRQFPMAATVFSGRAGTESTLRDKGNLLDVTMRSVVTGAGWNKASEVKGEDAGRSL